MAIPRSHSTRGVLLMFLSSMAYALSFTTVRELSESFSSYQLVLFRTGIGTAAMLPWLARSGLGALRTRRWGLYGVRAVIVYTSNLAWFYALTHLHLADATALSFLGPLFTVLILALWLRERLTSTRVVALLLGLAGALVLVRPGFASVGIATAAALYMALGSGTAAAMIRVLTRTEDRNAVVFFMFALNVPVALGPAITHWSAPGWADAPWILAFGVFSLLAQIFMTRSLAYAEAAIVMPTFYLQLPLVAILGWFLFGQVPELWLIPGAALIVGGGIFALRSEVAGAKTSSV